MSFTATPKVCDPTTYLDGPKNGYYKGLAHGSKFGVGKFDTFSEATMASLSEPRCVAITYSKKGKFTLRKGDKKGLRENKESKQKGEISWVKVSLNHSRNCEDEGDDGDEFFECI